jgi:superfamily II DNA or RNA helicase
VDRWPHQIQGVRDVQAALARGEKRVLLTSPTGGGKTQMMADLIEQWTAEGYRVALYTNRRLLVSQTSRAMDAAGVHHGVRAAGFEGEGFERVQICSVQTEASRVLKQGTWAIHNAQRILIDEAHLQTAAVMREFLERHIQAGASYVGLTATPLDLSDMYDCLVVAGTMSELRACGALVMADHYGPDEPDMRGVKAPLGEDLTEAQNVRAMMRPGLFGRVLDSYKKLNPERKPTILFAPGVKESLWFAQEFWKNGITAAHISGDAIWCNGVEARSSDKLREDLLNDSRFGNLAVLCNRFVLREGINCPWLAHGILACVFGSVQSYLQAGGRLLRAHPGLSRVTIQDHGGNWWRHGSLNADRSWRLVYTSGIVSGLREDLLRGDQRKEPARCPECNRVIFGSKCPCGRVIPLVMRSRAVIQADGELKQLGGRVYRPRRICGKANGPALWERMYYRSCTTKGKRSFRAAAALFAQENNWGWPDPSWPLMPKEPIDHFRLVSDVPRENLTSKEGP